MGLKSIWIYNKMKIFKILKIWIYRNKKYNVLEFLRLIDKNKKNLDILEWNFVIL